MGIEVMRGLELWRPRVYNEWEALRAGAWYGAAGTNTYQVSANRLYAAYVAVPRDVSIDRIGVSVHTGDADKSVRLGIYEDADRDGYPDRLVLDSGTVEVAEAGEKDLVIAQHLYAGSYYVAFLGDGAPALYANTAPRTRTPLGMITAKPSLYTQTWWVDVDYGALPHTFPAGAAADYREYQAGIRVAVVW